MPINADIYAQFLSRPATLATIGEMQQARDQRQIGQQNRQITDLKLKAATREEDEAARLAAQQAKLQGIFQRNTGPDGPNQKAILAEAYRDVPDLAPKIAEHFTKIQKDARDSEMANLDRIIKEQTIKKDILASDKDSLDKALNLWSIAKTPEDREYAAGFAKLHGVADELASMGLDASKPFSPEESARAAALTMTPEKRATMAATEAERKAVSDRAAADDRRADDAAKRQEAYQNAQLAISRGNLAVAQQGLRIREDAANKPALKPPTGAQNRVLNFFNRAKQASDDIDAVADEVAKMGKAGQAWMAVAPNFLQTGVGQKYTQAQRAFTEARLRKDSGAAIPNSEFENDKKTYFIQPGDDEATIAQKTRARAAVLASLAFEAGSALNGFYGDEADGMVDAYRAVAKGATPGVASSVRTPAPATAPTARVNPFKK